MLRRLLSLLKLRQKFVSIYSPHVSHNRWANSIHLGRCKAIDVVSLAISSWVSWIKIKPPPWRVSATDEVSRFLKQNTSPECDNKIFNIPWTKIIELNWKRHL